MFIWPRGAMRETFLISALHSRNGLVGSPADALTATVLERKKYGGSGIAAISAGTRLSTLTATPLTIVRCSNWRTGGFTVARKCQAGPRSRNTMIRLHPRVTIPNRRPANIGLQPTAAAAVAHR